VSGLMWAWGHMRQWKAKKSQDFQQCLVYYKNKNKINYVYIIVGHSIGESNAELRQ